MIRRISILLVILGSALLFFRQETLLPTLPFPPAGLTVKDVATIGSPGNYYVRVIMPKTDNSLGLSEETVPCSLRVIIIGTSQSAQKKEITTLSRYSEFGFGRTQSYRGGDAFHLDRGEYDIEVTGLGPCAAAASRGATFSLEHDVGNPTNWYFRSLFRLWIGVGTLCLGLLGLIAGEFKKPRQPQMPTA